MASNNINLIFPFEIPTISNKVSLSTTTYIKDTSVSFALPFNLSIATKPPNNSFPYAVKVKKSNEVYVYVLKFDEIDFKKFLSKWELHVTKDKVESYADILTDIDKKMEEYERKEKSGKRKKIRDEDGWVRYE